MELNKKRIATIGAAAAAIVVLAGGYAVSFANYSSTLEKARLGIEHFVTQSVQAEPGTISVEFYEPKAGLFSHDVTLVVTDGEDSFKLPMTIGAGYANYSIDLDLVNSKVNQENALKYFELNDLTKLEAYGKVSLISGQLNFTSNISFLNNSQALEAKAHALAFDLFQKEKAEQALQRAKIAKAKQDAEAAKALEKAKKDALNVTLESSRTKAKAQATAQAKAAAQAQAADAAAAAAAPADEQADVTSQAEAMEAQVLAMDNLSEQQASDQQEIDSVETIKNTPVTADMDTMGAAAEVEARAQAQAQAQEQEPSQELAQDLENSVASNDDSGIEIRELDESEIAKLEDHAHAHAQAVEPVQKAAPEQERAQEAVPEVVQELAVDPNYDIALDDPVPTVTYKYDTSLTMDENLAALKKMQEMAVINDQAKDEAKLASLAEQEFAKLKEQVGYKSVGNASINIVVDSDENVHSSVYVDSYHKAGVGFNNLNVYSESQGILSIANTGRTEMSLGSAYDVAYPTLAAIENVLLKLKSSRPTKSGNFSLDYAFKADSFDSYKYVDVSGKLKGLNVKLFNSKDILETFVHMIKENGLELSANKGSNYSVASFVRPDEYTEPQAKDIKIDFNGSLAFPKGEDFNLFFSLPQGKINFSLDAQADLIADPNFIYDQDVIKGFTIKDGKSYGSIEFVQKDGFPTILVNGQDIF